MAALRLEVLDCGVEIECTDERAHALLRDIYLSFERPITQTQVMYHITPGSSDDFILARHGECSEVASEPGDFISKFDKNLIIEVQKRRPDLYFVHAAVLGLRDYAIALVAPSGYGKSTTTWALLHHGFEYLSDEIAPIELGTIRVLPFARALCLKKNPPACYPLPSGPVVTGRTTYVPTSVFPANPVSGALPLSIIFFLRFIGEAQSPILKPMSSADATVRLLSNTLNPLAHPQCGLDRAIAITEKTSCFELLTGDLRRTCELVSAICIQKFISAGTRPDSVVL